MDTGFKRLWTRRKSKGRGSHAQAVSAAQTADTSTSKDHALGAAVVLPTDSARSARAAKEQPQPVNGSIREYSKLVSANDYERPASSGRIQPTLVGISRPSTSTTRPGTASSFQNAVSHAADRIDHSQIKIPSDAYADHKGHSRTKSPRYIDVFSILGKEQKSSRTYNEDIAERNLDLLRVALEGTQYRYVPSSKYQEEVASRNAHPPSFPKTNPDQSPTSHEDVRTSSLTGRSDPNSSVSGTGFAYTHQPSVESGPTLLRVTQDSTAYHSRQYSMRNREPKTQLPAIPQEHASEDGSTADALDLEQRKRGASQSKNPPQQRRDEESTRELEAPELGSTNQDKKMSPTAAVMDTASVAADVARGRQPTSTEPQSPMLRYQLAPSELQPLAHNAAPPTTKQPIINPKDGSVDVPKRPEYSVRSLSNLSTTSSIRRAIYLPDRTIMDLTGDDAEIFSDAQSESELSTPIVGEATSDSFQRMQASIIHSKSLDGSKDSYGAEDATGGEAAAQDSNKGNRPSIDSFERFPSLRKPASRPAPVSTFSPINTLVSLSPRTPRSGEPRHMSRTDRVKALLENARHDSASENTDRGRPVPSEPSSGVVATTDGGPQNPNETVPLTSGQQHSNTAHALQPVPEENDINTATDAGHEEQSQARSTVPGVESRAEGPQIVVQSTPRHIHMSPESLNSGDFVNPSGAFGVRTRDFAATPSKATGSTDVIATFLAQPTSKNAAPESVTRPANITRLSSRKPRMKQPKQTILTRPPYATTFDEEAFARKQEEARAALLRLQESLNEDLVGGTMMPSGRANSIHQAVTHNEAPLVPPTSIYAQVRHPSTAATSKAEADESSHRPSPSSPDTTGQRTQVDSRETLPSPKEEKGKGRAQDGKSPVDLTRETVLLPPSMPFVDSHDVPPSPGEVSLSSFPVPAASPRTSSGTEVRVLARRGSQKSATSNASAFSIPYHMIPDRTSSMTARVAREMEGR